MTRFHCYAIIKMKGWHGGVSEGVIEEQKARKNIFSEKSIGREGRRKRDSLDQGLSSQLKLLL